MDGAFVIVVLTSILPVRPKDYLHTGAIHPYVFKILATLERSLSKPVSFSPAQVTKYKIYNRAVVKKGAKRLNAIYQIRRCSQIH